MALKQKYAISKPHINYIDFSQQSILFNFNHELQLNNNDWEQFKTQLPNDKDLIIIWKKEDE